MADKFRNITLVGASGNLGSKTLDALLQHDTLNISVITRPSSTTEYPYKVTVKQGEYTDKAFLHSALQGQDVVVILLGFAGLPYQGAIIEAAASAGVKYIMPAEYGLDSSNNKTLNAVEVIQDKRDVQKKIETLGMKWIAVVTGPWIEYCLQYGVFDIFPLRREAKVYTDSAPFNITTLPQIAAAIAAFLNLPKATIDANFANKCLYVSSFRMTQPELFSTVLRVTSTNEADWRIERKTTHELVEEGHKMVKSGDSAGHFKIILGVTYQQDMGGDYSKLLHNERLGLGKEDLDDVVRHAVDNAEPEWAAGATMPK